MPVALGPLIEFLYLAACGSLPLEALSWLRDTQVIAFLKAWCDTHPNWLSQDGHFGFIRTSTDAAWETDSVAFLMEVQRAGREIALLPGTLPGQMAAAVSELASNIEEHSNSVNTGVVAFRATEGAFEFVVADQGIGVLRSLRSSPQFLTLDDHGRALELALTDGVSRFPDPRRGHGFRPIFQGLANLNGYLRFRSGDHAIVMDGTKQGLASAQLVQKPDLKGFFASITCRLG